MKQGRLVPIKCNHCGHRQSVWVDYEVDELSTLSPVAYAIIASAPPDFRRGVAVSILRLSILTGYSHTQTYRGIQELRKLGYITTQVYGRRGRVRYAGVPDLMLSEKVMIIAA